MGTAELMVHVTGTKATRLSGVAICIINSGRVDSAISPEAQKAESR